MALNPEVEDALVILAQHPAVSNVRVLSASSELGVIVAADFDTNLPSTWRALGESPTGVRPSETVEILFPADYPNWAPYPTLRPDFNASLPHINPHRKGERVPPCIVYGGTLDVLHNEGFGRLVDQMAIWLEKAGANQLIDQAQGWEPTRRDWSWHSLRIDADWLVERRKTLGSAQLYRVRSTWTHKGGLSITQNPRVMDNTLNPKDLLRLLNNIRTEELIYSGDTIFAICWSNSNGSVEAQIHDKYQPDTVETYADLLERAALLGCDQALKRFTDNLDFGARKVTVPNRLPIYVALAVRRPFPVIGLMSDFELLPYRIEVPMLRGLSSPHEVTVVPASFRTPISPSLLRRTSGLEEKQENIQTAFIGCGSLGSKVVMHVTRAGYGPSLLVDAANPSTHNAARHALHVFQLNSLFSKARKLAETVSEFGAAEPKLFEDRIQRLPIADEKFRKIFGGQSSVLVNTTASPAVRDYLSKASFKARVMEACAVDFGAGGILTLEGEGRNPSTADVMAYAYECMRRDGNLVVPDVAKEALLSVGVGCNSITLPMSDARISLIASGVGQSLLNYYQEGLPQVGRVAVAKVSTDGMSIQWQQSELGPTHVADPSDAPTWTVRILDSAHKKICEETKQYKKVETGGLIVGRVSVVSRQVIITDVLAAPPDSKRSYACFNLGTKDLVHRIKNYNDSGSGVLWCLGTWHSHLRAEGPSATDFSTADSLQGKLKGAAVLLIRRPDGYSAVIRR